MDVAKEKFQGAHKAQSQEVRSPKVPSAAAKNLGVQSMFLGTPGYQAPIIQHPCDLGLLIKFISKCFKFIRICNHNQEQ